VQAAFVIDVFAPRIVGWLVPAHPEDWTRGVQ
jgi:hypothetical protein